ncbi:MAG: hypothetical protein LC676_13005 [Loktanella sp.]|nr:hypothetical protein [Loktanella sp.]
MEILSGGLLIPAVILAFLGWLVPKLLSMVFPEGVKALFVLAFVASLIMFAISVVFFIALYMWQGVPLSRLLADGWAMNLQYFGRLALIAAMIWAPFLILSVAGLPRTWKKAVW